MNYEYEIEAKDIMSKTKDNDVHTRSLLLIADVLWEMNKKLDIIAWPVKGDLWTI